MGFVVLHINKASGNDAAMTAHIERTIDPKNADKERTHLQLVEYPDGVENRTAAIQRRLDTAGLTRKIGTNQVRALRIMLSGTPEDMVRIEAAGKLGEWCEDNMRWLRDTFGADNVVSADLHRDEKTPHIHATVVPIVTGERRKAATKAKPTDPNKKQYRKKPSNAVRLCADDVMTRDKLKGYQDSYAEIMGKYGLQRGIDGSEARHIQGRPYYINVSVDDDALIESYYAIARHSEQTPVEVKPLKVSPTDVYLHAYKVESLMQEAKAIFHLIKGRSYCPNLSAEDDALLERYHAIVKSNNVL